MSYCLTKPLAEKFLEAVKSGKINPKSLVTMTSEQRRKFFAEIIGQDNAKQVNALFESKLLLKSQKRGMVNWVKQLTGIKEQVRRDLLTRIENYDQILNPEDKNMFLEDIAEQRIGANISVEEANRIYELASKVKKYRAKANSDGIFPTETDRLNYGAAYVMYKDLVADLRLDKPNLIRMLREGNFGGIVTELSGAAKSLRASLDNSFFLRQGIKVLYTEPRIWANAIGKSFSDFSKEFRGVDAKDAVRADVYSRQNAMNGNYNRMEIDIGLEFEEAYPSALPEKIPLLKRLYKASETAYSNAALRMRADLADKMIERMEDAGINTKDKEQMKPVGDLINVMTGRGVLTLDPKTQRVANNLFFSIKFWKSNWDTIAMGMKGAAKVVNPRAEASFVDKQAARSLLHIVSTTALILMIAERLWPDSIEKDLRSSRFGKIKIGNRYHDITGGLNGITKLALLISPSYHNGEWGWFVKSGRTNKYTKLNEPGFGKQTVLDSLEAYWEGKAGPLTAVIRDIYSGRTFSGEKPSIKTVIRDLTVPLSIDQFYDVMKEEDADYKIASMILELFGSGMTTPYNEIWYPDQSIEKQQLYDKIGQERFVNAMGDYNKKLNEQLEELTTDSYYNNLNDDEKEEIISSVKKNVKKEIFKQYNFKPKYD